MKKLVFILLFWTILLPVMAQYNFLTVSGTVTDIANGAPVSNHPVSIQIDSTNAAGFTYYNVVNTFSNGFYVDTVYFNLGYIPIGTVVVSTMDCQQQTQYGSFAFGPGNQGFSKNFQICTTTSPCTADFSYQTSPNSLTVQFTDQSTGGGTYSYNWNFGDGGTSTQMNPSHTFPQQGYYNVTLWISDSLAGCFNTVSKTLMVGDSTGGGCTANFYSYSDSTNLMNVHFVDQSTGANFTHWHWDFGDGQTANVQFPSNPNVSHLYVQPGTYTVCLTIQSNDSTCFDTYCSSVVVGNNTGCQAQFTWYSDSTNTGAQTIHFIDLSIGGGSTWYWYFSDSTFSTEQNPVHTFPQAGTYYVCLTITGQNPACESTWCANVTVGSGSGCASYFTFSQSNLNVAFEGHMVNGQQATYVWSFGDGTGDAGQNVSHAYASPGMYYITLTTSTSMPNGNCTYTSGQTIQVGDSTQFNQIYGQVFAGTFPLTSGTVMIFSADSLNGYFDSVIIDSMGIYSFQYVPLGDFIVWAIPGNNTNYLPTYYGDVLSWQNATVITLGQPVNPYNIHLVQATNASAGNGGINGHINTGSFDGGLDDNIRMILMNEQGEGIGFSDVPSSGDFNFSTLGFGVYFLRGELPHVPSDLVRVELTAEKPVATVVLTYSGSHILGMKEPESPVVSVNVYPNPFNDVLNFSVNARKSTVISIILTDMTGRSVLNYSAMLNTGDNGGKINTSSYQPGIYLLKITSQEGSSITRKVVKTE